MIRTVPRCFAPQFAPPSPSVAADDCDALPAPYLDGPLVGPGAGAMYGGAKRPILGRYGQHPSYRGPSHSGPLAPPPSGLLPRSQSQPKPQIQDLSVAFAINNSNDSEDDSEDGTVLDAPLVSPGTAALTGAPLEVMASEDTSFRGKSNTAGGQGAVLNAAALDIPPYPQLTYNDDAPVPSPATLAIASAAAEMRSHEHRMTRYRQQLHSAGSKRGEAQREGPSGGRPTNRCKSKDFTGQAIRITASSQAQEIRPCSAAVSTKSSSMPSQSLEEVGSPFLAEQALAICQGFPGHTVQSAPSKLTKNLTVQIDKGSDDEDEAAAPSPNPWDITAMSTPRSDTSELYPSSSADGASPPPATATHKPAPPPKPDGAILVAAPVNAAPVKRPFILRSASEDRRPSALRPDPLFMEDKLGSGPSSLDNSPAHPSCMPKASGGHRRLPQGGAAPVGKNRVERLKSQLGRLSVGSNSPNGSLVPSQKHPRVPTKLPSSDSYDGSKATASRNLRDLYPVQGAPSDVRQAGPGMVRNARSLSPASWKRNFPALNIPYNTSDSPRSPPKPIAAAPVRQTQMHGRRK